MSQGSVLSETLPARVVATQQFFAIVARPTFKKAAAFRFVTKGGVSAWPHGLRDQR